MEAMRDETADAEHTKARRAAAKRWDQFARQLLAEETFATGIRLHGIEDKLEGIPERLEESLAQDEATGLQKALLDTE